MRLVGFKIYVTLFFVGHEKSHDLSKDLQYVRMHIHGEDLLKEYIECYSSKHVVEAMTVKIECIPSNLMYETKQAVQRRQRIKYVLFCVVTNMVTF